MGKCDSRLSWKMRRRKAQAKKKAKLARRRSENAKDAPKKGRTKKAAAGTDA